LGRQALATVMKPYRGPPMRFSAAFRAIGEGGRFQVIGSSRA
jgi:hypothetical protein